MYKYNKKPHKHTYLKTDHEKHHPLLLTVPVIEDNLHSAFHFKSSMIFMPIVYNKTLKKLNKIMVKILHSVCDFIPDAHQANLVRN